MDFDQWVISRLRTHGAYAGVVDGVAGRQMVAGLKRFQTASGLKPTGLADEETVGLLRKDPQKPDSPLTIFSAGAVPIPAEPVWMREARRFMGLKEVTGAASNGTILGWAKRLGGWVAGFYTNDDIPWCGLAVAHWISFTLPSEPLPANYLSALAWAKFGRQLEAPVLGAVLVFKRPGGGHVGLYVGEDASHFHVLGGNQSNSVSVTRIAKDRLEAIRWPATGGMPAGGRVALTASGAVSRNEA
ncbi:TIGR02594 family protein [Ensifer aridi]|uniref:TIGR02594 family protein n=1 Tax=Ensifer aridi TaxID=1708715 RepID=UPI000A0F6845|nr:TIGR02594 family protein [Ensifer aridi]